MGMDLHGVLLSVIREFYSRPRDTRFGAGWGHLADRTLVDKRMFVHDM
jgi:hypothetical protein